MQIELGDHEVAFLLAYVEKSKQTQLGRLDWATSHAAIVQRDKAIRQIELLDALIANLTPSESAPSDGAMWTVPIPVGPE